MESNIGKDLDHEQKPTEMSKPEECKTDQKPRSELVFASICEDAEDDDDLDEQTISLKPAVISHVHFGDSYFL
jgi:hypothetical protein